MVPASPLGHQLSVVYVGSDGTGFKYGDAVARREMLDKLVTNNLQSLTTVAGRTWSGRSRL
jgi:hypothetical protein